MQRSRCTSTYSSPPCHFPPPLHLTYSSRLQKLDDGSKKDFFSILTDQINSVTEEQLVAHGASFVIAGSETTATSLTATTYWLASHDEQRARLQAELLETFQSDSDIKAKQLQDLPYLNAVIKESMRLFPPVALGGVRVSPGTTVDGVYVPKGVCRDQLITPATGA